MLVNDLMKSTIYTCGPDDTAVRCAQLMRDHEVGIVPVIDPAGRLLGVVTDRDIAMRVVAQERPFRTQASQFMTSDVVTCRRDDPLPVAEARMAREGKSRLPVVDEAGYCVGIVSLSDVSREEDPERTAHLLNSVKTPRPKHAATPRRRA